MKYSHSQQFKNNKSIQHIHHNNHHNISHINHHRINHIANVFSSLFAVSSCVIVGLITHITGLQFGLETFYIFCGLSLALYFIEHNAKNSLLRYRLSLGLGFFFGLLLGPLLNYIIEWSPQLIMNSLLGTFFILVVFSYVSNVFTNGITFLQGIMGADIFLIIAINTLTSEGDLDPTIRILFLFETVFISFFIFYYRSKIMTKAITENKDYIHHTFDIFFELLNAFRNMFRRNRD